MSDERKRILDMLTARRITTEEADGLLAALEGAPARTPTATVAAGPSRERGPKYLRVIIDGTDRKDGGPLHVNVRIPILLLRAGVRLASVLPPQAQQRVSDALRERGMDVDLSSIKPDNVSALIDQLRDLTVDIDHESNDPDRKQDEVSVKIFVE